MVPNKPIESLEFKENFFVLEILSAGLELLIKDYVEEEATPTKILATFDKTVKVLGSRKLLEFEYLKNIFEILLLSYNNKLFENFTQEPVNFESEAANKNSETYKSLSLFSDRLIELNFFGKSIENFFYFEWNNSYQRLFEDLMVVIISSNADAVIDHVFGSLNFLEHIIEHSLTLKFVFNSGKFINNGYLPFLMEISFNIITSKSEALYNIVSQSKLPIK
jgi:hypothetical protein